MHLFDVNAPGNVYEFFSYFNELSQFDFVDVESLVSGDYYFPETHAINPKFVTAGYESQYVLVSLGFLLILIVSLLGIFVLNSLLYCCIPKCCKAIRNLID